MQYGATGETTQPRGHMAYLGWGLILAVVAGVFIGTVTLKPKKVES